MDSKLHAGSAPQVLYAFRLVPRGILSGLHDVTLRGDPEAMVRPAFDDPFKALVELRERVDPKTSAPRAPYDGWPAFERKRHGQGLKIVANSGCYGVPVEMIRRSLPKQAAIVRYRWDGRDKYPSNAVEVPGRYFFAPIAAMVAAAAHLDLGIMERLAPLRG